MKKTSVPKGFTINERRANSITWAALDAKRIFEVSRDVANWADVDDTWYAAHVAAELEKIIAEKKQK